MSWFDEYNNTEQIGIVVVVGVVLILVWNLAPTILNLLNVWLNTAFGIPGL